MVVELKQSNISFRLIPKPNVGSQHAKLFKIKIEVAEKILEKSLVTLK